MEKKREVQGDGTSERNGNMPYVRRPYVLADETERRMIYKKRRGPMTKFITNGGGVIEKVLVHIPHCEMNILPSMTPAPCFGVQQF